MVSKIWETFPRQNHPVRMRSLLYTRKYQVPPGRCGTFSSLWRFPWYELAPGGRWSGYYIVADIDDFTGRCLAQETSYTEFKIRPHITSRVTLGKRGIHFPCKARYEWYNHTLEGRDAFWECAPKEPLIDGLPHDEEKRDLQRLMIKVKLQT